MLQQMTRLCSPFIATRTVSGIYTSTFTLPPQTTPFVQPTTVWGCTGAVYCPSTTVSAGQECYHVDFMGTTWFDNLVTSCYPSGYSDIFFKAGTYDPHDPEDISTVALPGTECVEGWTTACTRTLSGFDDTNYVQIHCCPPGAWTCAPQNGRRDCTSSLSTFTEIWTDANGEAGLFQSSPLSALGEEEVPLTIYHPVYPLQVTMMVGTSAPRLTISSTSKTSSALTAAPLSRTLSPSTILTPTATSATKQPTNGYPTPSSKSTSTPAPTPGVSGSEVSGTAVVTVASIAILVLLGVWWHRRRKAATNKPTKRPNSSDQYLETQPDWAQAPGYGKAELPVEGSEIYELPHHPPPPAELPHNPVRASKIRFYLRISAETRHNSRNTPELPLHAAQIPGYGRPNDMT
ncbi:uncharacterized protein BCR38DRAFT_407689 [Pseudomassariella vexata]|uniref:Uncharacterized protein n=1 Tax=Pseudomassariella vexata TaxID=1141098 RepID=A0A1Y2EA59_9PEZI|nr:uncharacterized protein BCR38DRAFT_407689 [Pseudomassariella vexata]ORY67745.1 hypothetical protein BCR38DRAFT_407689 [Pseudomassariella vexata]